MLRDDLDGTIHRDASQAGAGVNPLVLVEQLGFLNPQSMQWILPVPVGVGLRLLVCGRAAFGRSEPLQKAKHQQIRTKHNASKYRAGASNRTHIGFDGLVAGGMRVLC